MPKIFDPADIVSTLVPGAKRVATALRCPVCLRSITPHDLNVDDERIELVCSHCFHVALTIEK